ncbi:MAG TPA: DUF4386 domain-containing protein [Solirubrobacteraceae bacterium]|nr:DUF4386 domain-containing protein [Solirubrobacteraceae bacterium]
MARPHSATLTSTGRRSSTPRRRAPAARGRGVGRRRRPSPATRVVEATIIAVGIVSVLAVVTLRKDLAGAVAGATSALLVTGRSLVAVHKWTFLLGPGVCAGLGNGLLLGYLMYRSELVPRRMALLGLIGGAPLLASDIAILFGAYKQTAGISGILTVPEAAWELSLGVYLIVKGFRTASPLIDTRGQREATPAGLPGPAVATS